MSLDSQSIDLPLGFSGDNFASERSVDWPKFKAKPIRILVSFSGGRTSGYMCYLLLAKYNARWHKEELCHVGFDEDGTEVHLIFVFANTGKERVETLLFCDQCDRHFGLHLIWVEAVVNGKDEGTTHKIVNFQTASRRGEPFEAVIAKYGLPNQAFPHCTRETKLQPIKSYILTRWKDGDYITAIGIRYDEPRRIKMRHGKTYPLWDAEVTVKAVRKFWHEQPFDLQLKDYEGNCDFCWKKSYRKLLTLLQDDGSVIDWWHDMQVRYGNFSGGRDTSDFPPPYTCFRGGKSTMDIVEMAKQPFVPASDPFWKEQKCDALDTEQACHCGNNEEDDI